jgi:hypothetical protein
MASDRDDAVLLRLLVNRINDYEPNLVKLIKTILDLLGATEKHFEKVFGTSLESFVIDGILNLNGKCNTEEKEKPTNEDNVSMCLSCYLILNATQNQLSQGA